MEGESLFDHAAPTEGAVAAGWKGNLKTCGVTCGHRGRIEHQGGCGQWGQDGGSHHLLIGMTWRIPDKHTNNGNMWKNKHSLHVWKSYTIVYLKTQQHNIKFCKNGKYWLLNKITTLIAKNNHESKINKANKKSVNRRSVSLEQLAACGYTWDSNGKPLGWKCLIVCFLHCLWNLAGEAKERCLLLLLSTKLNTERACLILNLYATQWNHDKCMCNTAPEWRFLTCGNFRKMLQNSHWKASCKH